MCVHVRVQPAAAASHVPALLLCRRTMCVGQPGMHARAIRVLPAPRHAVQALRQPGRARRARPALLRDPRPAASPAGAPPALRAARALNHLRGAPRFLRLSAAHPQAPTLLRRTKTLTCPSTSPRPRPATLYPRPSAAGCARLQDAATHRICIAWSCLRVITRSPCRAATHVNATLRANLGSPAARFCSTRCPMCSIHSKAYSQCCCPWCVCMPVSGRACTRHQCGTCTL